MLNFEFIGDGSRIITGLSPLDDPHKDHISYSKSAKARIIASFSEFGALIVPLEAKDAAQAHDPGHSGCFIFAKDPYALLVRMISIFFPSKPSRTGIHPTAIIDKTSTVGNDVAIGAHTVIEESCRIEDGVQIDANVTIYGDVSIGKNTKIYAGVVIREGTSIGAHCIIHANAVLGADGFGYVPDPVLGLKAIPQVGRVIIEDYVDIGAGTCIDRATLGSTTISYGTKIDNQVQIGHNTRIGKFSIICGQTGIAGSCTIGDQVTLAGGVGIADHVSIASKVRFSAKAGAKSSITEPGDYMGYPAMPIAEGRRNEVIYRKLYEIVATIKKELKALRAEISSQK